MQYIQAPATPHVHICLHSQSPYFDRLRQVPKGEPTKFDSEDLLAGPSWTLECARMQCTEDLRTDVVKAHLSMGVMCADGERRAACFSTHPGLAASKRHISCRRL